MSRGHSCARSSGTGIRPEAYLAGSVDAVCCVLGAYRAETDGRDRQRAGGTTFLKARTDLRRNLELDPASAEKAAATLRTKMEGYERILSKQAWIGGDEMTLADLFHLPFGAALTSVRSAHAPQL